MKTGVAARPLLRGDKTWSVSVSEYFGIAVGPINGLLGRDAANDSLRKPPESGGRL